ncbi:mechanosensitive ion channel family protein [Aquibium microcysteis]|uniref:mechanosensitive ion channel family protein n=1 Tax=Aquibium microcysteis TaxID=675281 RepID=UPI00165D0811|nr:mechanosensitive ion channel family protein [Aquibium microcysteis]
MNRMRVVVLFVASLLIPAAAAAQTGLPMAQRAPAAAETTAQPPAAADVQELLRLLGDPSVVEWLKQAAAERPQAEDDERASLRAAVERRLAAARQRMAELASAWSNFPLVPEVLADAWRSQLSRGDALRSLTYVVIFVFVGGGLEWLFWQYLHPTLVRIEHAIPRTLMRRLSAATSRLFLQALAIAVFSIGSVGAFLSFTWPGFLERVVVNLLIGVIAVRSLATLSRFLLAPRSPSLRLVPLDDRLASKVHGWNVFVAVVFVTSLLVSDTLAALARTASGSLQAQGAALAVSVGLGALTTLAVLAMIWSMTPRIIREVAMPSFALGRLEPVAVRLLPIAQSLVLIAALLLWIAGARELMWTVLIIGLFAPAMTLARAMIDHFFDRAEEAAEREDAAAAADEAKLHPDGASAASSPAADLEGLPRAAPPASAAEAAAGRYAIYRPIVRRLVRFLLAVATLFALAAAWGTDIFALAETPTIAGRIAKVAINVVAVLLLADLIWVWARTAIDRRLAGYVAPPPGEAPGPEARMATLLPLMRNILLVTILVIGGLTMLSSVGVNIAPLLAGAGIVGVAVGFGTQSLVRDIVSGIFFLVDDAFRVGEYVEIGDLRGTVESMSLRSMRVRHHRGAVHTIPFGELKSLTNYSRDWVIMKLEFRVPFETDLRLVKKLVKQVGAELQADPAYGHYIIETLKSQGVRRMEEFNMVVGVKFMARPGAQWVIRRDAYHKLRDAFEKNGIHFAQRNVKVEVLSEIPLPDQVREAVAGAAQTVIEAQRPAAPARDEP